MSRLAVFVQQQSASAPGTATSFNLAPPPTGFRGFVSAFGSGVECFYVIESADRTMREWGRGQATSGSPDTFTRTTVLGNSSGTTARLNFTGVVNVYNDALAENGSLLIPAPAQADHAVRRVDVLDERQGATVIPSGSVSAIDFAIPAWAQAVRVVGGGLVSTVAAAFAFRFSYDTAATFPSGSTEFTNSGGYSDTTGWLNLTPGTGSVATLSLTLTTGAGCFFEAMIFPGLSGSYPTHVQANTTNTITGSPAVRSVHSSRSATAGRPTHFRLLPTSGVIDNRGFISVAGIR